jgi:peptidoglycan/LPS O-acetylase OafA/YrhL
MRRIVLSVLAGQLVISAVTLVSFVVLNAATADLNTTAWLATKLLISLLGGALGGYTASRLAGRERARAVLVLAGLATLLSAAAIAVKFGSEPLWFQAALALGAGPAVWLGGRRSAAEQEPALDGTPAHCAADICRR